MRVTEDTLTLRLLREFYAIDGSAHHSVVSAFGLDATFLDPSPSRSRPVAPVFR